MPTLGDLFTAEELDRAATLRDSCEDHEFASRCASEIVEPVLPRINRATGQENDARYLAYAILNALGQVRRPGP